MNYSRRRKAIGLQVLFMILSTCVFAQSETTLVQICQNKASSVGTLECQPPIEFSGSVSYPLALPFNNTFNDPETGLTCSFQFYTVNGSIYFADNLPTLLQVDEGEVVKIVAWYRCTGGPGCVLPPEECSKANSVVGIDATNGVLIQGASVVASVEPAGTEGNCLGTANPCGTDTYNATSIINFKSQVNNLTFDSWKYGNNKGSTTTAQTPGTGRVYAFYKESDKVAGLIRFFPYKFIIDDIRRIPPIDIPRICQFVLDCPGCGPDMLCPGWAFQLKGAEDFRVSIVDVETGKILAKEEVTPNGMKRLYYDPGVKDYSQIKSSHKLQFEAIKRKGMDMKRRLDPYEVQVELLVGSKRGK